MRKEYECLVALLLLTSAARAEVTFQWAAVGNAGNANASWGYGAVGYAYQIGKHEVTNGQYAEFLNAKAASDPLALYHASMSGTGITRSGPAGSHTYAVTGGYANKPVVYVSWYSAARFANWVNNGQGNAADTESGAYTLTGGTPEPANGQTVARNAGAAVFLPSLNEWYKAAYHQPAAAGGDGDDYWDFPTRSNATPIGQPPPGGSNSANFDAPEADLYRVFDVGAYAASTSYYGTFDQGGSVWEWNEAQPTGADSRGGRGGAFDSEWVSLAAYVGGTSTPSGSNVVGFRLASVPEPLGLGVIAVGGIALLRRRRCRA